MTDSATRGETAGDGGPGDGLAGGADALDELTVRAAGILAEAVREASIPGVVEFRTVATALDRAVKDRSRTALQHAESTFDRMDEEVRADINALASTKAHESRAAAPTAAPDPLASPPAVPPSATKALAGEPLFAFSRGRIHRSG